MNKVRILKLFCLLICVGMITVTVVTSMKQNIMDVLPRMIHDPWTVATFIDFYNNILIITAWVAYKENHIVRTLAWFVAFVLLGSIATSFYVFLQLGKLKDGDSLDKILVR